MKNDTSASGEAAAFEDAGTVREHSAAAGLPDTPTVFARFSAYKQLMRRFREVEEKQISLPYFLPRDSINDSVVKWADGQYINWSGYNYLGLSGHPDVSRAAKDAIDQYGTSASASRIVSGQLALHEELEHEIADFLGVEDCIIFVSGYGTNVTTIGHLFGRNDLVMHDTLAHNSIIAGCKQSEARRLSFHHNDWDQMDAVLQAQRTKHRNVLVTVEAVYSMEGDIADVRRAIEIKRKHDALLMVDEAHSLGILGANGGGICEHFGIDPRDIDIHMGTLSKTFASCGGFIAGERALVQLLRYTAPGFIFSVGLSPPDTAAALAALRVLRREGNRVGELRQRARFFRDCAREYGLNMGSDDDTPIVPLVVGDPHRCMRLSQRLFELGIHVQPIVYPAVKADAARLRFFITINHTEEQTRHTMATVARELAKLHSEGDAAN